MDLIKQSTAVVIKFGPFVDSTDGYTTESTLSISQADIRLSKNGADFGQSNNAAGATHDEKGYYDVPLDATDTGTLGRLRIAVTETGALPVWQDVMVVPAVVYDSLVAGSDRLAVDVEEIGNNIITAASIADAAIDAATFAAGAINAAAIATDAIDADAIAAGAIDAAAIADNAIDLAAYASDLKTGNAIKANVETITAGAITAAAIATDAIDNDALAANAVTEIQSGLSTLDAAGVRTAVGLASANLDTQLADLPTAAENADAVWDEASTGHTDAGKAGQQIWTDIDAILADTGTNGVVVGSVAAGAINAAAIATDAIDNDAIAANAVTEIQAGLSTLDAAGVRTAVGLATANLDTQLDALPTAAENAAALLDLADGIETNLTPRQALRLIAAALAGVLSGAETTEVTIKGAGVATSRIVATVDANGNRSAITLTRG